MSDPVFLDTNVLVYAALQPDPRSEVARDLMARRGTISVQVLNEFVNVAHRKLRRSWPEIMTAVRAIRDLCPPPTPITLATHEAALGFASRTGYQFYDALIIAAALEFGLHHAIFGRPPGRTGDRKQSDHSQSVQNSGGMTTGTISSRLAIPRSQRMNIFLHGMDFEVPFLRGSFYKSTSHPQWSV